MLLTLSWNLKYLLGQTRWDTGVVPPELVEFVEDGLVVPSKALDVGCGSGTIAIYLSQNGFDVTGLDVAWLAIRRARQNAHRENVSVRFETRDFLKFSQGHFDLVLDVGCLHSLLSKDQARYVEALRRVLNVGGSYLLYAWGPREFRGGTYGLRPDAVQELLGPTFSLERLWTGEERGAPSHWCRFVRRSDDD